MKIIDLGIAGNLGQLVVAYKDRLCRIGYDLIEHILLTISLDEEFAKLLLNRKEVKTMSSNMELIFIHDHINDIPWNWIAISDREDIWTPKNRWFLAKYGDCIIKKSKESKRIELYSPGGSKF